MLGTETPMCVAPQNWTVGGGDAIETTLATRAAMISR